MNSTLTTEEKYYVHNIAWIVLNRLKDFNDKPQLIFDLSAKFNKLVSHTIYFKFAPLYEEAVKYYEIHNKFCDIKYLNERFPDGRLIWEMTNSALSMDMFDKLKKQLDYEILIQDFNDRLGKSELPDMEGCREFSKRLAKFADSGVEIPQDTKDDWLSAYDGYKETYHGISTGIKMLDENVGDLGGVVTIAAPSGNGKSTFSLSLAYNISTLPDENGNGRNVLYISFEMTKFQLQANLVSIESSFCENMNKRLKATNIKNKELTPTEEELFKEHMASLLNRLNFSGGYISLVDNTAMNGYTTIEEFMAVIEEHSANIGKKFDIIFIDNIDSLNMLKGERGQSDMDKMNGFITKLDAFSKTYMDGYGTCIVLLSQTNREGIEKLFKVMENKSTDKDSSVDGRVLKSYSALYERATTVLILYSSRLMRANSQLKVLPVKLRNKPLPTEPLILAASWDYAYIGRYTNQAIEPIPVVSNSDSSANPDDDIDLLLDKDW